jgi:hypothetical protein
VTGPPAAVDVLARAAAGIAADAEAFAALQRPVPAAPDARRSAPRARRLNAHAVRVTEPPAHTARRTGVLCAR